MKTLVLFLSFLFPILASAQTTAVQKAEALTSKMQSQVGFNDDTKVKVQEINLDFVGKLAKVRSDGSSKLEKVKAFKQLDDERAEKFKAIFTESEYKLFEKFRTENRQEVKERYKASK